MFYPDILTIFTLNKLISIYPENDHFLVHWQDFATTFMLRFYDETLKMLPNNNYLVHGLVSDKQSKSILKVTRIIYPYFSLQIHKMRTLNECQHLENVPIFGIYPSYVFPVSNSRDTSKDILNYTSFCHVYP